RELLRRYFLNGKRKHQGYPVVDKDGNLLGVVARSDLLDNWLFEALGEAGAAGGPAGSPIIVYDLLARDPVTVYPWGACRTAAERMAKAGVGRLVVGSPADARKILGIVTRSDLLKSRALTLEEEEARERYLLAQAAPPT